MDIHHLKGSVLGPTPEYTHFVVQLLQVAVQIGTSTVNNVYFVWLMAHLKGFVEW